jgi:two-component system response regulator HydG
VADATTVLVSADPALPKVVEEVVSQIHGVQFVLDKDHDAACKRVDREQVSLILYHLVPTGHVADLTRLLSTVSATGRKVPVLAISDEHHAKQALTLLRLGVAEYFSRPLDLSRLGYLIDVLTIDARYGHTRAMVEEPSAEVVLSLDEETPFIFGSGEQMSRTIDQIKRVAPLETTILLGGETGTGKTRLAGVIHRLSPRRDHPFLTINCGALAANLIESEMFGHVKGAYTGADAERTGKFAAVGRGTLFLDEVDSLSPSLQAKLLRVVEERAFEPVGSNKTQRLQARLIAASNRPLEAEVAAGRFRSDLFYRLNVVAFDLPPLRDRKEVIPPLARSLLGETSARNGLGVKEIAPTAVQALLGYSWPGNIRELRNVMERAAALAHGPAVTVGDLPDHLHPAAGAEPSNWALPATSPSTTEDALPLAAAPPARAPAFSSRQTTLAASKDLAERAVIGEALERNGNNRLRAAAELGISRMSLYKKLHKYGLMGAS